MRTFSFLIKILLLFVSTPSFCLNFVTLEYRPLEYIDSSGKVSGPMPELICTVLQKLGETCHVEVLPWPRAMRLAKNGEVDGIFTTFRTAEREVFLDFTNIPLIEQEIYLYAKTAGPVTPNVSLQDLHKWRIGVTSSISYGEIFDNIIKTQNLTIDRADDLGSTIRKLLAGRIDLFVSNRFSFENARENYQLKDSITQISEKIQSTHSFLAFSKKRGDHSELIRKFDDALTEIKANGEYLRILKKFGLPH